MGKFRIAVGSLPVGNQFKDGGAFAFSGPFDTVFCSLVHFEKIIPVNRYPLHGESVRPVGNIPPFSDTGIVQPRGRSHLKMIVVDNKYVQ